MMRIMGGVGAHVWILMNIAAMASALIFNLQYVQADYLYLLNCGADALSSSSTAATRSTSSGVISSDTRTWATNESLYLSSSSSSPSASFSTTINNNPAPADPLSTARVLESPSSYTFRVDPGYRYWVRLYFAPQALASAQELDPQFASFDVTATVNSNPASVYTLLYQFKPSDHQNDMSTGNNNIPYLFKEYSVNVITGTTLVLGFAPSSAASVFAYINAIEVVSMPAGLITDTTTPVAPGNTLTSAPIGIPYAAMETIYRLNVGGPAVGPMNDSSGLYRRWAANDGRSSLMAPVVNPDALKNLSILLSDVTYDTVPMAIAPPIVYSTALTSNYSTSTYPQGVNLSWSLPVSDQTEYVYMVRLHFCDLQDTTSGSRKFDIFLQNVTAFRDLDIQTQVYPTLNRPLYWDFTFKSAAADILIQAGPRPGSPDLDLNHAIMNGIEVWKLNNTFGSLDLYGVPSSSPSPGAKPLSVGAIVGVTIAGCVVLALVLVGLVCLCRSRRVESVRKPKKRGRATSLASWVEEMNNPRGTGHRPSSYSSNSTDQTPSSIKPQPDPRGNMYTTNGAGVSMMTMSGPGHDFTFSEVLVATNSFDESRIIGVGGFGKVYLGEIVDVNSGTRKVAVKRGSRSSQQGIVEFRTEIDMLSRLRHRHLVSLIGYCEEEEEMILVYEYMSNGAFRDHLYGPRLEQVGGALSWKQRLEICIGATRGIHYLHTGVSKCIIHRDLKSTNILLDEKLVAKVADFGLSKEGPLIDQTHVSTAVKGSFGYLDPEYFRRQKLTEKSDVYSLGVVLLEALCGRAVINPKLPREQVNIVEWALRCVQRGRLDEVIDPCLVGTINSRSLSKYVETVEKCLEEQGARRPTVGEVLWNLEHCLSLQAQDPPGRDDARSLDHQRRPVGSVAAQQYSPTIGRVKYGNNDGDGDDDDAGRVESAEARRTSTGTDDGDGDTTALFSQIVNPQGR